MLEKVLYMRLTTLALVLAIASSALAGSAIWVPTRVVALDYPRLAAMSRIDGQVQLLCFLSDGGEVERVKVLDGHPLLAVEAAANAKRWAFVAKSNGKMVDSHSAGHPPPMHLTLTYDFSFADGTIDSDPFVFESPGRVSVTGKVTDWTPSVSEVAGLSR